MSQEYEATVDADPIVRASNDIHELEDAASQTSGALSESSSSSVALIQQDLDTDDLTNGSASEMDTEEQLTETEAEADAVSSKYKDSVAERRLRAFIKVRLLFSRLTARDSY